MKEIENNRVRFKNEEKNKKLHFMALKLDVLDTITDGELTREVEEFERLLIESRSVISDRTFALHSYHLGLYHFKIEKYEKAINYFQWAIHFDEKLFFHAASLALFSCDKLGISPPSVFLDGNHLVVTKEEKVLSQVYGYFILKNDKVAWEELENYIMDIIYDNLKYITDPWTYQFFNDELDYLTNTSGNRTKFYKWKQRKF